MPYMLGEPPAEPALYSVAESSREVRVRSATHALLVDKADGARRLFDRTAEVFERTDVSAGEPEILAELTQALRAWREQLVPLRAAAAEVDQETIEGLRALGYIE